MASTSTLSARSQSIDQSQSLPQEVAAPVVLLGRVLFGLIFVMSGASHFTSQTVAYAASQGVPLASIAVPLSGVIALAGGLSILLGYKAKIGAWLLVLFLAVVTPMMHNFWAVTDPMMHQIQMAMFMKNLSMLGGAIRRRPVESRRAPQVIAMQTHASNWRGFEPAVKTKRRAALKAALQYRYLYAESYAAVSSDTGGWNGSS
jgi:putative oxidoreductase